MVLLPLLSLSLPLQAAGDLPTAPVELREVPRSFVAQGRVEAVQQSTVAAQISGRVVEVNFDVGDRVEKGQVLVRIAEDEVVSGLAASQAQVAQARAALLNAQSHYRRSEQLVERGFISQAALDAARADRDVARANLEAMEASAGQAAATRAYATVLAPYSGVVARRQVELGELARPGTPLMTGFDPATLRVVAEVPQHEMAAIRRHHEASVELPALHRSVPVTEMTFLPIADPRSHTSQIRLDLKQADVTGIYPGMFARARFVLGREPRLLVPSRAVVRRSEVSGVYVVADDGEPRFRLVRLGEAFEDGRYLEVLAGLHAGERVVLEPVRAGMQAVRQRGSS